MNRREFFEYFNKNYAQLPEYSLRGDNGIYFVMSAIAANINLFEFDVINTSINSAAYQRTFSCDKIYGTGESPLATPLEVLCSFFRFNDPTPSESIKVLLDFFQYALGMSANEFIVRTSDVFDFPFHLENCGIQQKNIFLSKKMLTLRLGEGRPVGEYMFFHLPYKHGMIPVGTLGFIKTPTGFATDSSIHIELLEMVRENKLYLPQTKKYENLHTEIINHPIFGTSPIQSQYMWIYLFRSIIVMMWDGIKPGNAYAEHYLKRIIRELTYSVIDYPVDAIEISNLITPTIADLKMMDYLVSEKEVKRIELLLLESFGNAHSQISKGINKFKTVPDKLIEDSFANEFAGEQGIRKEWMINELRKMGNASHSIKIKEQRYSLKHNCYPYFDGETIDYQKKILDSQRHYEKH